MKIIYASDIHTSRDHLNSLLGQANDADAIIIGGDIVPKECFASKFRQGGPDAALRAQKEYLKKDFIPILKKYMEEGNNLQRKKIYLDLGNDDFWAIREILKPYSGELFYLLHGNKFQLTPDVDILGYMCVPPTPFGMKDLEKPDTEEEPATSAQVSTYGMFSSGNKVKMKYLDMHGNDTIEADMEKLSKKIDKPFIFVSHCPPYGTALDCLYDGQSVGSRAIRAFIEKWAADGRLLGSFHGHIHESPMVSGQTWIKIGDAVCVNPGQRELDFMFFEFEILGGKVVLDEKVRLSGIRELPNANGHGRTELR